MEYIFLFTLAIILIYLNQKTKSDKYMILFILLLSVFSGLRYGIGTDYESYVTIFEKLPPNIEIGYSALNYLIAVLGLNVHFVFGISTLIMLLNIFYGVKKFHVDSSISMLLYLGIYFLPHNFNLVRHGLAASFVLLALGFLKNKDTRKAVLFILVGTAFHSVSIVMLPFVLLLDRKFSFKFIIICLISFSLIGYFDIVKHLMQFFVNLFPDSTIAYKINYYINDYYNNLNVAQPLTSLSLGFFLRFAIFSLFLYINNRMSNYKVDLELNTLFFGLIGMLLLINYDIFSSRIINLFYLIEIVLLPSILKLNIHKKTRIVIITCLVIYSATFGLKLLMSKEIDGSYQYIPYESVLFK